MRSFGRDKKFGERSSFGKPRFGAGSHDRPTMHKATCSRCGKDCEVPFRPNGSKPVLCRDCFRKENGGTSGGFERKSFDRPSAPVRMPDPRPMYEELTAVNAKLDKILNLLEPSTEK